MRSALNGRLSKLVCHLRGLIEHLIASTTTIQAGDEARANAVLTAGRKVASRYLLITARHLQMSTRSSCPSNTTGGLPFRPKLFRRDFQTHLRPQQAVRPTRLTNCLKDSGSKLVGVMCTVVLCKPVRRRDRLAQRDAVLCLYKRALRGITFVLY